MDTAGQKFDPNRHEALFEMPDPSVPSGTIAQVVETGYAIGDRVLRPAKVGCRASGPKAEAANQNDNAAWRWDRHDLITRSPRPPLLPSASASFMRAEPA